MATTPLSQNFAPGHYQMWWGSAQGIGGVFGGLCEGVRMLNRTSISQAQQSDLYGKSDIDAVFQGGQVAVAMTLKEWSLTTRRMIWPYGYETPDTTNGFGKVATAARPLGTLNTRVAEEFTLVAVSGTPADSAAGGLSKIIFGLACISPDTEVGILLGNEQRDIPVVFKIYPCLMSSDVGNTPRWFMYAGPNLLANEAADPAVTLPPKRTVPTEVSKNG